MSDLRAAARPRLVADAPVERLAGAADELAKRWAMALIAERELSDAPRLALSELAGEAPALTETLVRSLASDAHLALLPRVAEGVCRMAGARDGADAVRAVEALRAVVWDALMEEMRGVRPVQVAELAARLAHAAAEVAAVAVGEVSGSGASGGAAAGYDAPPGRLAASEPAVRPAPAAGAGASAYGGPADRAAPAAEPHPAVVIPFVAEPAIPGPRPPLGDVADEGPAAWIGSIGRRLERFAEDQLPFAVLLIEVADVDRLGHALETAEMAALLGQVERSLSGELRPADALTRESPGRYWLVTPETDHEAARTLAERLARAVHGGPAHRGVPLQVAIGLAVCPDDGQDAAGLAARADVGVYAARAAGRPLG